MRFYVDNPGHETEVIWYFLPPGRQAIPHPNPFCSRVWERDEQDPGIGERLDYHPYYRGDNEGWGNGRTFCGSKDQWINGAKTTDPLPELNPETGLPVCCSGGVINSDGGIVIGGEKAPPPIPVESEPGNQVLGGDAEVTPRAVSQPGNLVLGGEGNLDFDKASKQGASLVLGGEGNLDFDKASKQSGGQVFGGEGYFPKDRASPQGGGIVLGGSPPLIPADPPLCGFAEAGPYLLAEVSDKVGGAACMPDFLEFTWDGTVWKLITPMPECFPVTSDARFLECDIDAFQIRWVDEGGTVSPSSVVNDPFQAVYILINRPFFDGPGSCVITVENA